MAYKPNKPKNTNQQSQPNPRHDHPHPSAKAPVTRPAPADDWRGSLGSASVAASPPQTQRGAPNKPQASPAQPTSAEQREEPPTSPRTREQRLLVGIHAALAVLEQGKAPGMTGRAMSPEDLEKRAESLPLMIQRHGPAQTLLFLDNKGKDRIEDAALAWVFRKALAIAKEPLAERLPQQGARTLKEAMAPDLTGRLHLTARCLELSNLLIRTVKVMKLNKPNKPNQQTASAGNEP